MLTYLKYLIVSLFGGFFAALPVSYSGHYSYLNTVMSMTDDKDQLGFFFSVISFVFAFAVLIKLRKIYSKTFRISFTSKSKLEDPEIKKSCTSTLLSLLISLLPAALMFVPLPGGSWAMDVIVSLLQKDYQLAVAACCIGSGLFLFLAIWYTSRHYDKPHRTAKPLAVLRFAIYQIPSYVEDQVIAREVLLYLAPSMLIVNTARIVRYVLAGIALQPIPLAITVAGALIGSSLALHLISKFNIRKNYLFFAIYSVLFGFLIIVTSFLL